MQSTCISKLHVLRSRSLLVHFAIYKIAEVSTPDRSIQSKVNNESRKLHREMDRCRTPVPQRYMCCGQGHCWYILQYIKSYKLQRQIDRFRAKETMKRGSSIVRRIDAERLCHKVTCAAVEVIVGTSCNT